ncbi:MAG: hypothetical protein IPP94_03525 [Ignavibacteria bacterium]|nr:hypothetical protein [Ignavibacteria bacterium]
MSSTWDEIRKKAKKQTDDAFAAKVSGLTRLTDEEILAITPTATDKQRFAELMGIVADAALSNEEKADALRKVEGLAEIAVPLLMKLL